MKQWSEGEELYLPRRETFVGSKPTDDITGLPSAVVTLNAFMFGRENSNKIKKHRNSSFCFFYRKAKVDAHTYIYTYIIVDPCYIFPIEVEEPCFYTVSAFKTNKEIPWGKTLFEPELFFCKFFLKKFMEWFIYRTPKHPEAVSQSELSRNEKCLPKVPLHWGNLENCWRPSQEHHQTYGRRPCQAQSPNWSFQGDVAVLLQSDPWA